MRRITEFKGYRSFIDFDRETGTFVSKSLMPDVNTLSLNEAICAWAEVLPLPLSFEPETSIDTKHYEAKKPAGKKLASR